MIPFAAALRRLAHCWGCPMPAEVPADVMAALQAVADARARAKGDDADAEAKRQNAEAAKGEYAAALETANESHQAQGAAFDAFEALFRKYAGQ